MSKPQIPDTVRTQVRSIELEAAMLGLLMTDKYAPMQAMDLLSEACFTEKEHLQLYRAIRKLDLEGHEISQLSVLDELENQLTKDAASRLIAQTAAIFACQERISPDYAAVRLQEYAKRRALAAVAQNLTRLSTDMTYDMGQAIGEAQELISTAIMGKGDSYLSLSQTLDALKQVVTDNQNPATQHLGMLCGIPQVDATGGLPSDGLIVIGAKASHGKTSFVTNVAFNALSSGHKIAFYSLEMNPEKITARIVSMKSGISSNAIRRLRLSQFEQERVFSVIDSLQATIAQQFYFDNRRVRDIDALVMSIRALKKTIGTDCIVVDYLQLMNDPPGQRSETPNKLFGGIAHRLHEVAQDLHITILLLSQINRTVDGEPTMANLRDSGEIGEAADMVIILYNADFEHRNFARPFDRIDPKGKLLAKIEKNRDGQPFSLLLGFEASETRIFTLDRVEEMPVEESLF